MEILAGVILVATTTFTRAAEPGPARKIDFNYQIRPILSDKCFHCHGPDTGKRKAGLRLDTKAGAFAALKSGGHAIVPKDVERASSSRGSPPRTRPTGCRRSRWGGR